ncbi:hypothetical protein D3C77_330400 [compost metagenome]
MFSDRAPSRYWVGPATSTNSSSTMARKRFSSERRLTPLSSPVTADRPARAMTTPMRPKRNSSPEVSIPVSRVIPADSCSTP